MAVRLNVTFCVVGPALADAPLLLERARGLEPQVHGVAQMFVLTRMLTAATRRPFMTRAKMPAASASWLLITWAYTRRVIDGSAWPSRAATTCTWVPAGSRADPRGYRAARSMNVIGGHVPACASPVTSKPCRW